MQIRVANTSDATAIRNIYAPYVESTAISFETNPPTVEYFQQSIAERVKQYPWLVAHEEDGEVIGYAYASEFATRAAYRWSVEVSIYIGQGQHRKGVGKALYAKLLPILQQQGFRMAFAGVTLPNAASKGLHESFGFQQVANLPKAGNKFSEWHDVGWWALDLQPEGAQSPSEPIPFASLSL